MLPIVRNADALNVSARRSLIAAMIVLPTMIGAASSLRGETLSPATIEPAATPPQVTESKATTATTAVTRAPSPSDELNTLLMHATFLIVGPTKAPNQFRLARSSSWASPTKTTPSSRTSSW